MAKEILLTKGKVAVVDDGDYEWLSKYFWVASESEKGRWYAKRSGGKRGSKMIYMHRQIVNAPEGMEVDHKDRDTLNNTRSNLRVCTRSQNNINKALCHASKTSKYRGVSWDASRGKWTVSIKGGERNAITGRRKIIHLGRFSCEIAAAQSYDTAAAAAFGEFACLNFPKGTR